MDYFSILNLNKEPFSNSPDPDYFFHSNQHVGCLQKLELSLRLRRGLNVVIGDVGTGKTTLCRQLIRKFKDDTEIETHLILDPYFSTPHEFLFTVAEMLGTEKPDTGDDDYQLKEQIKQCLFKKGVDEKRTIVLIIDEGQKIPEFCLELLREFLNYETNDYKLLQIAIFAQKEFEKILEQRANFADRINLYHRLEPMSFKDTRLMIQFRLNQSSAVAQKLAVFTYPALWAIYRATQGYPRKIVNLCHRSILTMIIQNKTKANWFLVKSCMKRAFEGGRKRSWLLASIAALVIISGVLLIPRFYSEGIQTAMTEVQSKPFEIQAAQEIKTAEQTASAQENSAPTSHAADPKPSVPLNAAAAENIASIPTTPEIKPEKIQTAGLDKQSTGSAPVPVLVNPRPKILGQLKVRRKETLGGMIQNIYGIFKTSYLNAVLEMNPHIVDPDTIDIGEVIVFPALPLNIRPHAKPHWWVEVGRRDKIENAFNILRQNRELSSSSRLIPFWNPQTGLQFSIVLNRYYYDEESALNMRNSLALDLFTESNLISSWGKETLFYANPYLGL